MKRAELDDLYNRVARLENTVIIVADEIWNERCDRIKRPDLKKERDFTVEPVLTARLKKKRTRKKGTRP